MEVAWNPEFLRESFAVEETLRPDRLVLGFDTEHSRAEAVLRQCFETIIEAGTPTIVSLRRRRHHARRHPRPRRPHRPTRHAARPRLRRRLPAQGHLRLHGPRR
ncbi:hypothetical protein [Streptomyces lusitanus]|uniref:hypothetical protein n=1 Tax=Streptomyces lusitanus TaxID=68232 RepID=UPI0021BF0F7C|nr:hypothetical protein [Streptomyces lusitanus]